MLRVINRNLKQRKKFLRVFFTYNSINGRRNCTQLFGIFVRKGSNENVSILSRWVFEGTCIIRKPTSIHPLRSNVRWSKRQQQWFDKNESHHVVTTLVFHCKKDLYRPLMALSTCSRRLLNIANRILVNSFFLNILEHMQKQCIHRRFR